MSFLKVFSNKSSRAKSKGRVPDEPSSPFEPHERANPGLTPRSYNKLCESHEPHLINTWKSIQPSTKTINFRGGWKELRTMYTLAIQNTEAEKIINGCGWSELFKINVPPADKKIPLALLERWWYTTHTFHLPFLEIGITPFDFTVLTGIPTGNGTVPPFHLEARTEDDDTDDLQTYFPSMCYLFNNEIELKKHSVPVARFREFLEQVQNFNDNSEELGQEIARAFLMWVLGWVLIPNPSSNISLRWLPAFHNLNDVSSYDWGSVILSQLYKALDENCIGGSTSFNGMWMILEYWFYVHFNDLLPVLIDATPRYMARIPIISAYNRENHGAQIDTGKSDFWKTRSKLESATPNGIVWDPYVRIKRIYGVTEGLLKDALDFSETRCILFNPEAQTGVWYLGDRCWRQLHPREIVIPANPPSWKDMSNVPRQFFDELARQGWNDCKPYFTPTTEDIWTEYWSHVSKGIIYPPRVREWTRDVEFVASTQDPQLLHQNPPPEGQERYIYPTRGSQLDMSEYCSWTATAWCSKDATTEVALNRNLNPAQVYHPQKHTNVEWAQIVTELKEENRALREWGLNESRKQFISQNRRSQSRRSTSGNSSGGASEVPSRRPSSGENFNTTPQTQQRYSDAGGEWNPGYMQLVTPPNAGPRHSDYVGNVQPYYPMFENMAECSTRPRNTQDSAETTVPDTQVPPESLNNQWASWDVDELLHPRGY